MPAQMTTEDIEFEDIEFGDKISFAEFSEWVRNVRMRIPADKADESTICFRRITRGFYETDEVLEIVVAYPRLETEAETRERERCDAYNRKQRRDYYLKLKAEFETEEA